MSSFDQVQSESVSAGGVVDQVESVSITPTGYAVGSLTGANGRELKRRTISSTVWLISSSIAHKTIRLLSSVILTRLLAPEIFGIMAIASSIRAGIVMFTDIGLRGKMIEDKRSDEPRFYNTIWTYGFIRSWVLFIILCAASFPLAMVYGEPDLAWVVPILGLTLVLNAISTNVFSLMSRNLRMGTPTKVGLLVKIITVVVTVSWAIVDPSIRALLAGIIFGQLVRLVASYVVVPGFRNRFFWDREIMRSVVNFGRWILLSTAAQFLITHGDRMLLGIVLISSDLGIYSIAIVIADAVLDFVRSLSSRLLQVVYARLHDRGGNRLRQRMGQIRWGVLALAMPCMAIFAVFGSHFVALLYDQRYAEAGWMLQVLAVAGSVEIILVTATNSLLSRGDSFRFMMYQTTRGILTLTSISVGYLLGGVFGVLVGRVAVNFLAYVVAAWALSHHKLWMPKQDFVAILVFTLIVVLGVWLLPAFPSPFELGL